MDPQLCHSRPRSFWDYQPPPDRLAGMGSGFRAAKSYLPTWSNTAWYPEDHGTPFPATHVETHSPRERGDLLVWGRLRRWWASALGGR